MTPPEIAAELRALATEMLRIGMAMEYWGGLNPMGDHGRELLRAGEIARGWAAAIEVEEPQT